MEWLNFIATEVHKSFGPLWKPDTPEATKETQKKLLAQKFDYLTNALKGKEYLTGNFSIADAYLFTVLNWANILKLDMSKWPDLQSYVSRIAARPKVQQSLKEEGLIN
jgi:glutathione S-transferase